MSRGLIRRRGKASWELKFDVPSDNGKRRTRYVTVRGTRQDAQCELTKLLRAADAGVLPEPDNATVAAYIDNWLRGAPKGSAKTLERYGELAANQINPHLGAIKLQKLRPEDVQTWHGALLAVGLSRRTVKHAHKFLHRILGDAVKNGTIARNVAAIHSPPAVEETEIEILQPVQIADVLARLKDHWLYPIVAVGLMTGMRRGELLALQWGDADLDAGSLRIERSLEETRAGVRFKAPKTRRGRRNIKLSTETVAVLRAHKVGQLERRLMLGLGKIEPGTLIFESVEGKPLIPHSVSRAWRRFVVANDLPRVSFHALRHSHASALIRAGVDILTISRRLGHSKAAITLVTHRQMGRTPSTTNAAPPNPSFDRLGGNSGGNSRFVALKNGRSGEI